jgi:hypothetical protein
VQFLSRRPFNNRQSTIAICEAHVVQGRDGALKTRPVSVQIRPWAPTACSPRQRRSAQTGKVAGALQFAIADKPVWGIHLARLGKSTPRHSAIYRSRASAQVDFISPLRPGQHRRLRPFASMQQPADCFCKAILPEHLWELQDYGATTGVSVARKEEGACRVRIIRRPSGF